ncbi:MAG: hypothetical protein J6N32_08350 [Clostridia bacterium]|nr:hypothetical protein [Clostridia bacterium]
MEHRILKRYPVGNPHRLWKQDNFILSTFSARGDNMRDTLENCAAAGFNMVELGWAGHEQAQEALRICEELSLPLLYQDFSVFGGMQERNLERHIAPSVARKLADEIRPWKCVVGYYVCDEPYVEDQLHETRYQMDLFQNEDPARLPFTVAIPSYNSKYTWENGEFAAYLRRYVEIIDPPQLSLDYYPIGLRWYTDEKQLDDSFMWCDIGLMRKLGREYRMPVWFYYQGVNLYKYKTFEFPMVRMMMYAAAMYGFKGLQQYTAVGSVINGDGSCGQFFEEQKQIHGEFRHLGNTLMALENRYVFHSADLLADYPYYDEFRDNIADSAVLTGELADRVSVGELEDAYGNTYLMVLNRDFAAAKTVTLNFKETVRLYSVSRETGRQIPMDGEVDTTTIELAAGDAALIRVQPAAEEAYTIEYRLEKNL